MALFESKKLKQLQQQVKALQSLNTQRIGAQIQSYINRSFNSTTYYPDWNTQKQTDKYVTSDQVYSVVNKIAETSSLIPIYPYINKEEKSYRQLKALTTRQFYTAKGIFDIQVMQAKAFEDAPENDELALLLAKPNDYQSANEFFNAAYCYYLLNGECIIYKERLDAAANAGKVAALHLWPPANVTINVTNDYPQEITGYNFTINGREVLKNVTPEDVIHWKKFNPYVSIDGNHLRGLSPLRPGSMPVMRLEEADNRSLNQLKNGAVPGIVFDETFEGDETEQTIFDNQKKAFYDFTKNPSNQGAPFFVGSKKGYIQTGLSAADLKIIELQKIDFDRLCNIYKVSTILFNSDSSSTESNVQEMTKQMYTSACLPMVYSCTQKLTSDLAPDFPDAKRVINCDISAITELQDDVKDMITAIAAMPITITGNEQRAMLKYDAIDLPYMNEPLIKSGFQFYDEVSIAPVDNNLLNE